MKRTESNFSWKRFTTKQKLQSHTLKKICHEWKIKSIIAQTRQFVNLICKMFCQYAMYFNIVVYIASHWSKLFRKNSNVITKNLIWILTILTNNRVEFHHQKCRWQWFKNCLKNLMQHCTKVLRNLSIWQTMNRITMKLMKTNILNFRKVMNFLMIVTSMHWVNNIQKWYLNHVMNDNFNKIQNVI